MPADLEWITLHRAHTSLKCSPFSVLNATGLKRPHTLSPGQITQDAERSEATLSFFKIIIRSRILIECCNNYYLQSKVPVCAFLRKWNKRKKKEPTISYPSGVGAAAARGLCHSLRLSRLNSHVVLHVQWGFLRGAKVIAPSHHPWG